MVTQALRRARRLRARPRRGGRGGFTMVEVMVAAMLIGVGVIGAVAAITMASGLLHRAELEERAAILAATLLDSIAQAPSATPGETVANGLRAAWWVEELSSGTMVELLVEPAIAARAGWRFAAIHTPPLPRWPVPEEDP